MLSYVQPKPVDSFAALDYLSTPIAVLDLDANILFINSALENEFAVSRRNAVGQAFHQYMESIHGAMAATEELPKKPQPIGAAQSVRTAVDEAAAPWQALVASLDHQVVQLKTPQFQLSLHREGEHIIVECFVLRHQAQGERSLPFAAQALENKELIRNLAHEIKNPLGGIRGAAQLLQRGLMQDQVLSEQEAKEQVHLTHIVIREADRLQVLVDRLLAPHRQPRHSEAFNIHEACERVRSVLLAEFPSRLEVVRDYDASLPELWADREQIIQAVLNIAQNAAQAMLPYGGNHAHQTNRFASASTNANTHQSEARTQQSEARTQQNEARAQQNEARAQQNEANSQQNETKAQPAARLVLKTRIARRLHIGTVLHRLAIELHIIDNGPGIDAKVKERIFYPLVSGRDGGSGLGLTLAQTIVHNHGGLISVHSEPGLTDFKILLPLEHSA